MKKLIPAMCMLLIAAALLGTSTYAWFSMNSSVTAKGMQITAKSDSVFLQIIAGPKSGEGATTFNENTAQTEATAIVGSSTTGLKPTAVSTVGDAYSAPVNGSTSGTPSAEFGALKFVQAYSNDPADWDGTEALSYTDVTSEATTTGPYTLVNVFQVRLNPKTGGTSASNLRVSAASVTAASGVDVTMLPAVRVLVVCGNNWAIWKSSGEYIYSTKVDTKTSILADSVSSTETTEVKVYIYFDGQDEATTTNNAALLATNGYDVTVSFEVG